MTKLEFQHSRIKSRLELLNRIVKEFKKLEPDAIHQFGSGGKGFKDEFSDIDVWITFKDEDIEKALQKLSQTFERIAPVLVRHHSKSWSPVGGSASSVIQEINGNIIVTDYYVSKVSQTVLKNDAVVLYGEDNIKRGEWVLNRHVDAKIHDSHTLKKDTDLLLDLICISYKGILRKWTDNNFLNTIKLVHQKFREKYPNILRPRRIGLNFKSNHRLLLDLYKISNKRQKRAINKIKRFANQIETIYQVI